MSGFYRVLELLKNLEEVEEEVWIIGKYKMREEKDIISFLSCFCLIVLYNCILEKCLEVI